MPAPKPSRTDVPDTPDAPAPRLRGLYAIFVASGFAALIYQVVWQRSLFAIYGISVEAVTVVVTAFMLGLGLGSLAGGHASRDPRRPALLWFAAIESAVGVFGILSLPLIRAVGALTLAAPAWATALLTFLLVLVPTLLMGATLPLLVAHVVRRDRNVGRAVGVLYFVNTLGSALAALLAGVVLLHFVGQQAATRLAGAINLAVGARAAQLYARERAHTRRASTSASTSTSEPAS